MAGGRGLAVRFGRLLGPLFLAVGCGDGGPASGSGSGPGPAPAAREGSALDGSSPSPEDAARDAIALIAAGDREALLEVALTEAEFREVVYPELPASRPERNTSADFVWGTLRQRSRHSLAFTLDRYRGEPLELVAVDFLGETTDYGAFRVHRETALTVRRPDGERSVVRLFGSMIERHGRFKIFSFVTD